MYLFYYLNVVLYCSYEFEVWIFSLILKQSIRSPHVIATVLQPRVLDFKSACRRHKELTVGVMKIKV